MKRLAVGMIVLDGMPFLPYALASVTEVADLIVVVEGAVQAAGVREPDCRGWVSRDGTGDYLEETADIQLVQAGGGVEDKTTLWNLYLDEMRGYRYVLNLDSDEVISHPEHLREAMDFMDRHPEIDRLDLPVTHFYGDLEHTIHGGPWEQPFRRLWRRHAGERFVSHRPPFLQWQEQGALATELRLFHYSWLGREWSRRKSEFYQRLRPDHPTYGRHLEWWMRVYLRALEDEDYKGEPDWGLHVSEGEPGSFRLPFTGQHPAPIRAGLESGALRCPA